MSIRLAAAGSPLTGLSVNVSCALLGLVGVAAVIVLQPWLLSRQFLHHQSKSGVPGRLVSLFEIPYITWYLIHYSIAALGIVAVVMLALAHLIDSSIIGTLLSGLFGFVLGNAASSHRQNAAATMTTSQPQGPAAKAEGAAGDA